MIEGTTVNLDTEAATNAGQAPKSMGGTNNKVTIFISDAREDHQLARALYNQLSGVFPFSSLEVIFDERSFQLGSEWRALIRESLDKADILLILFSDRSKASHSFNGYEVGYFDSSKSQRKLMADKPEFERLIIPVCVGTKFPITADYFQGIMVDQKNVFELGETDPSRDIMRTLLNRIAGIVSAISGLDINYAAFGKSLSNAANELI